MNDRSLEDQNHPIRPASNNQTSEFLLYGSRGRRSRTNSITDDGKDGQEDGERGYQRLESSQEKAARSKEEASQWGTMARHGSAGGVWSEHHHFSTEYSSCQAYHLAWPGHPAIVELMPVVEEIAEKDRCCRRTRLGSNLAIF